jgi:Flp pilus assembly protein TadD
MGWIVLAGIGLFAAVLLWVLGIARALWAFAGAALMLGAAGYALQGRPGQPGHPVVANATPLSVDPGLVALRESMFQRFTLDSAYFTAGDAMTQSGDTHAAVAVMLGGVRKLPDSPSLWTGLGTAYAAQDGGQVSPAARFAFQQAMRIAPKHPGPPFFLGLAYVREAKFAEARDCWARALKLTPATAPYRQDIAMRLAVLDRYLELANAPGGLPAQE